MSAPTLKTAEPIVALEPSKISCRNTAALALTIPPKNERTVGHWLLYYWEHASRHLGMMEALRGVFGEAGSARG